MTDPAVLQALWQEENRRVRQYQVTGNVIGLASFFLSVWIIWASITPVFVIWWYALPAAIVACLGWQGVAYSRDWVVFHFARAKYWLAKLELAEEDEAAQGAYLADKEGPYPLSSMWISVLMTITIVSSLVLLVAIVVALS